MSSPNGGRTNGHSDSSPRLPDLPTLPDPLVMTEAATPPTAAPAASESMSTLIKILLPYTAVLTTVVLLALALCAMRWCWKKRTRNSHRVFVQNGGPAPIPALPYRHRMQFAPNPIPLDGSTQSLAPLVQSMSVQSLPSSIRAASPPRNTAGAFQPETPMVKMSQGSSMRRASLQPPKPLQADIWNAPVFNIGAVADSPITVNLKKGESSDMLNMSTPRVPRSNPIRRPSPLIDAADNTDSSMAKAAPLKHRRHMQLQKENRMGRRSQSCEDIREGEVSNARTLRRPEAIQQTQAKHQQLTQQERRRLRRSQSLSDLHRKPAKYAWS
ncbi:uncharacterized protein LOC135804587 [Sycon ciliatum]|uniref:uncharacterized protein LOC135804587 n=1 Tax=Sycon ciliatum TaxID=27933 RepID=UPI0031F63539